MLLASRSGITLWYRHEDNIILGLRERLVWFSMNGRKLIICWWMRGHNEVEQ